MTKISNNDLLGAGKQKKERKEKVSVNVDNSVMLCRDDYPQGRKFEGAEFIEMMRRKGWVDMMEEKKEEKEKEEKKPIKGMKITKTKKG